MKDEKPSIYYIENLTVDSWVFSVLPYFLKRGIRALKKMEQISYFSNSRLGLWMAKITLLPAKKQLKRMDFSQGVTRDNEGNLIWIKTIEDAALIYDDIKNNLEFKKAVKGLGCPNSLNLFLGKWMMVCDLMAADTYLLLKFIFFVRVVEHQQMLDDAARISERNVFLFMRERPWFSEMERFVRAKGINVIPTISFYFYAKVFLSKFDDLKFCIKESGKKAMYYWMVIQYKRKNKVNAVSDVAGSEDKHLKVSQSRMAVEYYGHLNLDSPELFSDLFFFQKSSLCAQDILIHFGLPKAPVTDKELNEITGHGMSAVAVNSRAAATPYVPLFNHRRKINRPRCLDGQAKDKKDIFSYKWLQRHVQGYHRRYNYWVDFVTQHHVKIHVTWFKYSPDHCAMLDAVRNAGGVGVVYQRSFDYFMNPWTFTTADVVFGFSSRGVHQGRDKDSVIPYYVITGYLGDHRFCLLQKRAQDVRTSIKNHGAKRIVAYFDEHATNHPRWDLAYQVTIKNYSFLLNKVLDDPQCGLILKPKVPLTIRLRLGAISLLLRRAEATGRCFVFENSNDSPAVAALGADIAIHGHLFAATAGIESALAGVPTLILDSEGVPGGVFHHGKDGRIIFRDIESLWRACQEHWNRPGGIPGFADWSDILDELDPFRDGRAAERMGVYLEWLMDGFKAGLPRQTVLADAAQRYSDKWGKDKILSINTSVKDFNQNYLIRKG